jgi:hypothetical protein
MNVGSAALEGALRSTSEAATESLRSAIPARLGQPVSYDALTVVPLFATERPRLEFVSLDEALAGGLSVEEVDDAGAVGLVKVRNPLACAVLLYEGRRDRAKQDRFFCATGTRPRLFRVGGAGVLCRAPQMVIRFPALHVLTVRRVPVRLRAASVAGQEGVWAEVQVTMGRLGVHSETDAAKELYARSSRTLDAYCAAFPAQPGQCGSVVLIGGRGVGGDYVSRPEVHADIHTKLVQGYALDAIAAASEEAAASEASFGEDVRHASEEFVPGIAAARKQPARPAGCGQLWQVLSTCVTGWELRNRGEVIALSIVQR